MTPQQFESIKRYVGFTSESSEVLRHYLPQALPHIGAIVDDFYDAIQAHPDATASMTGGAEQVARLKGSLKRWIEQVLAGPHDASFLEKHARIGRIHVRINLPQEFMFTAMNRIRSRLVEIANSSAEGSVNAGAAAQLAVHQILDLELAIMLDSYREDLMQRIRTQERLATIGQLSATVAHELRNPLGTIESSLYLINSRLERLDLKDAVLNKHYGKIANQVSECTRIISALLSLARDRPLRVTSVRVAEFIHAAKEDIQASGDIRMTSSAADDLLLHGDFDQLKLGLANLLRNAVQAVSKNGSVEVEAFRRGDEIVVAVEDDGPGVDPNARHRIFELLFTTKSSGTGLGLALARRVCEAHGGSLDLVHSDRGARFEMRLPVTK